MKLNGITLKHMRWSHMFSYGANNHIDLSANSLTQLIGKNGDGKSSIALVLEEILFNKNSKGTKRAKVLNRYGNVKKYSGEVEFSKDGDDYKVIISRTNTSGTISLEKNGEDISSHTATGTYKLLSSILGMDHKAFSQIVYQSSANSLEFLSTTDGGRKKFLVDLLDLERYTKIQDRFKELAQGVSKQVTAVSAKVGSIEAWISRSSKTNLEKGVTDPVPEQPDALRTALADREARLATIAQRNKRIEQNNTYIAILAKQQKIIELPEKPDPSINVGKLKETLAINDHTVRAAKAYIAEINSLGATCPTCHQEVHQDFVDKLKREQESKILAIVEQSQAVNKILAEYTAKKVRYDKDVAALAEWERVHALIDHNEQRELDVDSELRAEIADLKSQISKVQTAIAAITKRNSEIMANNAKIDQIVSQIEEMQSELVAHNSELALLNSELGKLEILVKAFGNNGLIAYKIECMIKDLEALTNEYLQDLSDGRFQLYFEVVGDKLNVVINDNEQDVEIGELSGGERARVNVAALLAIRKLMQSLSNTKINVLILDETFDALDVEGKEKLVEVLLDEPHLNTFLVSHGFSHPLLEKVYVEKHNKISRIVENG